MIGYYPRLENPFYPAIYTLPQKIYSITIKAKSKSKWLFSLFVLFLLIELLSFSHLCFMFVYRFNGSRAILSGPAGGVVGYALTTFHKETELPVIGFDMGGKSILMAYITLKN